MNNSTVRKPLLSVLISQILAVPASAAVVSINCGDTAKLISAITTANTTAGADKINLNVDNQANCVYPLTGVNNNIDGANGLPSITGSLTINGNQSAIQRQAGSPDFRIIHVASTGNLTLKQLSIENGSAIGGGLQKKGGGIFNDGKLTLKNSMVSENTANGDGGGIFNSQNATTKLTNSTVSKNTANRGGGIVNDHATVEITNSTVSENTANDDDGGGIVNANYSTATLTNSTVSGNTASRGGGIVNANYSTVKLTNSTISGNIANGNGGFGDGGGIFNASSTAELINSTVSGNTAASWGWGGGIFNAYVTDLAALPNSTVSGNTANRNSDSIFNYYYYYYSTATLKNTILAGNTATSSPDCSNYDGIINANHYNLFGGNGTQCNAGATDLNLTELSMTIDNVLNTTLADNGGTTQTLALLPYSPAIDAVVGNADCPATDQRGVSRPQSAACDIGAFEYQPPDLVHLSDFQAIATAQGIRLTWQTAAAIDNAGFRLFRANLDQYGGYTHITLLDHPQARTLTATPLEAVMDWSHLIAVADSGESCYSYLDASASVAGTTYFYLLEDVNMGGYSTYHWNQIVSATVGQNSNGEENLLCEAD